MRICQICIFIIVLIILFKAVRILVGMETAPVMIQITMKPAYLMAEIAVDLMSMLFGAPNAYALKGIVEVVIRNGFWMVIVMIETIILIVALMVGIVVDLTSIH